MLLVKLEALFRRHTLRPCLLIVAVDLAESFQHEPALFRKIRGYLYEVSPAVRDVFELPRIDGGLFQA
jgi:hypothetical protein